MRRPLHPHRGSVVLVALCFAAVIGIALTGYIAVATHAMRTSNRGFYIQSAAQFAAMGLERSLQALNENSWTSWTNLSGGSLSSTDTDAKLSFSLTSSNYSTSGITGTIKARIYHRNASTYWSSTAAYTTADMVYHRGVWFQCISSVSAGGAPPHRNTTNWVSAPAVWNPAATYTRNSSTAGDIVIYGSAVYRCTASNSNQLPTDTTYWTSLSLADWSSSTNYVVGRVALYKGTVFRCIQVHSNQTPPNSTYWVGVPTIYAESSVTLPGSSQPIHTQFRAEIAPASLFPNAVAASTAVTLSAAAIIDSYDSNIPYDPTYPATAEPSNIVWSSSASYPVGAVVNSAGLLYRCIQANSNKTPASNAAYWVRPAGYSAVVTGGNTSSTAVTVTSARINGYVAAPSNTASPYAPRTSFGTSAVLTGSALSTVTPTTKVDNSRVIRNDFIPQFSINTPSTSGSTALPNTNATHNLGTAGASSPTVYYYNGNLNITDSRTYVINGPVQIVVNGYYYQSLNGGSAKIQITNNTSAKLEMFIAGDIAIYGNGIENLTYSPKTCAIYGTTTATAPDMSTTMPFYGVVYLPNGNFKVVGAQNLFGAFSAKNITFSAAAIMHYDTTLRTTAFTGADIPFAITSWRELIAPSEQLTL